MKVFKTAIESAVCLQHSTITKSFLKGDFYGQIQNGGLMRTSSKKNHSFSAIYFLLYRYISFFFISPFLCYRWQQLCHEFSSAVLRNQMAVAPILNFLLFLKTIYRRIFRKCYSTLLVQNEYLVMPQTILGSLLNRKQFFFFFNLFFPDAINL